jgi:hypothetical protein
VNGNIVQYDSGFSELLRVWLFLQDDVAIEIFTLVNKGAEFHLK